MHVYRIISDDGREVVLSISKKSQYPYQEIAKITGTNKMRNYRVEKVCDN